MKRGVAVDRVFWGLKPLCAGNVDAGVEVAAASRQVSSQLDVTIVRSFEKDIGAAADGAALRVVCAARLAHAARALSSEGVARAFFWADLIAAVAAAPAPPKSSLSSRIGSAKINKSATFRRD